MGKTKGKRSGWRAGSPRHSSDDLKSTDHIPPRRPSQKALKAAALHAAPLGSLDAGSIDLPTPKPKKTAAGLTANAGFSTPKRAKAARVVIECVAARLTSWRRSSP